MGWLDRVAPLMPADLSQLDRLDGRTNMDELTPDEVAAWKQEAAESPYVIKVSKETYDRLLEELEREPQVVPGLAALVEKHRQEPA